jgi:hypothetical protein
MVKMDQHIWVDKLLVNLLVINLNKMVQHQLHLVKQIVFSVETLDSIQLKILLEDSSVKLDLLLLLELHWVKMDVLVVSVMLSLPHLKMQLKL